MLDKDGNVYMYIERGRPLIGRFTIMSPVNGTWHAYLVPLADAQSNAITFSDRFSNPYNPPEGQEVQVHVSGNIDNSEAIIFISPTNFFNDFESKYRLDFYVENLGKWTKVSLTGDVDYDNYTIVRKLNLIQP